MTKRTVPSVPDGSSPSTPADDGADLFVAGQVIADRYRIDALVGKGGMGEVYRAWDQSKQTAVAVKTILRARIGNEKVVARFQQEAELSRRISHDNVLRIDDVFELERPDLFEPIPCMVMELLEGEALSDRLQRVQRMTTDEALPVVCQMASALAASHRAGVVHRDLKPDNVFLIPLADGGMRTVLTDFGVARSAGARPAPGAAAFDQSDSLTATNVILGTPFYMAPEQLELETATPATDIYTFGLVIYEMITGTLPFLAQSTLQTVFRRVREDPASPKEHVPDLDDVWEATVLRCLARDPSQRFASADDICRALTGGPTSGEEPPASEDRERDAPASPPPAEPLAEPTAEGEDRVPVLWIAGMIAVVVLVAVLIVVLAT